MQFFSLFHSAPIAFLACIVLSACSPSPKVATFHGMTMGTTYSVKVVSDGSVNIPQLQKHVDDQLKATNQIFSTYIEDSELMVFNADAVGQTRLLSKELYALMKLNLYLNKVSDGSFNIAIGPLINLWGFGEHSEEYPDVADVDVRRILSQIDSAGALTFSGEHVTKNKAQYFNMSATAKGYAVDQIAQLLIKAGYDDFLVEIGGELRGLGQKPNNEPWIIAIEKPIVGERSFQQLLGIQDISVATSGDYRNFYEKEGRRMSHLIDPKTGYPIRHKLASVTVLHNDCAMADGLATAMLVMGEQKAKALAKDLNVAVYLISKEGDSFVSWHNSEMQNYFLN